MNSSDEYDEQETSCFTDNYDPNDKPDVYDEVTTGCFEDNKMAMLRRKKSSYCWKIMHTFESLSQEEDFNKLVRELKNSGKFHIKLS